MNTKDKNSYEDEILKKAYKQITPTDSWEQLRWRISNRLVDSQAESVRSDTNSSLGFWRNLSFAMAACFIVTAGMLIYTIGLNHGTNLNNHQTVSAYSSRLISLDEMKMLTDAFSQVKQLFGDRSRWIVIGSGNESQVGLPDNPQSDADAHKLIVVRLAVSSDSQNSQRQYYDVVTYADQKTHLQLPLKNETALTINLKPIITDNGAIAVEIAADIDSGSHSKSKCAIASESFTPLLNMNVNGEWIKIDGVGRSTPADGMMML